MNTGTLKVLLLLLICVFSAQAITLDEAIALGKKRSLKQQGPVIDQMKVNGQIKEAWSNALPQISGTVAYQRAWKKLEIYQPNMSTGEMQKVPQQLDNGAIGEATLSQPLYTFGRIGAGLAAAYSARTANMHLTENTTRELELDIMKKYWTVQLLREVVDVRRNGLAVSDSALTKVKRLRDVGMMSDYDVLRAQVQVNNQKPQMLQAENNLKLSEMAFREALGIALDSNVTVDGALSISATDTIVESIDQLRSHINSRPDLQGLKYYTDVYRNGYTIYKNMGMPTIGAQLKYAWQWGNEKWAINPYNNASSLVGSVAIQIPIWTSGQVSGKAQQFKADWKKSQLSLEQAERGAKLQFESAIDSYRTAIMNEQAASTTVEQAVQARQIAQTKLAQGQITPLEMDAAHLDEMVAKVALAQAKFDRLVACAETRMAAGTTPYRQ